MRVQSSATGQRAGGLFVMPVSSSSKLGPVAVWITAAGWAAAAGRRWGRSWVLTPEGVFTAEDARVRASRPDLGFASRPSWRRHVPAGAKTLAKDVLAVRGARRFKDAGASGPWSNDRLRLVWQNHQMFHTAGFVAARRAGCPVVLFVDAPLVWEARKWGVRRAGYGGLLERVGEWPQLRSADLVACVSDEVAEQVRVRGVPEERIVVTPCAVDPEVFSPDRSSPRVRERLGLAGKFVVGWVGSFHRWHGVGLAIEALARLRPALPDVALLLVGDGAERAAIEAAAVTAGLDNIVFTGTVPHAEVPEMMTAMDVALVLDPGVEEFHYSPLKLREYMACGRPVVAPRVGDIARLLTHEVDGLLVAPGDAVALAATITRLRGSAGLRTALGEAARQKVLASATWDHQLERAVAALDRQLPVARTGGARRG